MAVKHSAKQALSICSYFHPLNLSLRAHFDVEEGNLFFLNSGIYFLLFVSNSSE